MRKEIKLEIMTEPKIPGHKLNVILWVLIAIVFSTSAVLTVHAVNEWEKVQSYHDV